MQGHRARSSIGGAILLHQEVQKTGERERAHGKCEFTCFSTKAANSYVPVSPNSRATIKSNDFRVKTTALQADLRFHCMISCKSTAHQFKGGLTRSPPYKGVRRGVPPEEFAESKEVGALKVVLEARAPIQPRRQVWSSSSCMR